MQLKSLISERFSWPILLLQNILNMRSTKRSDGVVSPKHGKFSTLPETQCAICFENGAFNATLADPARVLQTFIISPNDQADTAMTTDGSSSHPIYNPYETTCGHIYCYQCIAERIMHTADEAESNLGWECLRCGEFVKEAHRHRMELPESGSEYDFSSDLDISTNFSGSTYTFSETGFSE
jgi:peroxin-2